jgi:hypothetical protein
MAGRLDRRTVNGEQTHSAITQQSSWFQVGENRLRLGPCDSACIQA